ncbi:CHAP domain-containing protein [Kocuria sp. MNB10]
MDLTVTYRGPDGMSQQLWDEVRARYGARAQNKGFITGYMADARAGSTGGHFADRHGITHAVDIGVDIEADGTGLLPADALALAEHLRALGAGGQHPFSKRGYLIHDLSTTTTPAPRIAGFHTGWKWQVYTGASPHSDHIHVTTGGDQQWGGPPQLDPAVYNSRASWGVQQKGAVVSTDTRAAAEIAEWLDHAPGLAMDPDGSYGLQCKDVPDQFGIDVYQVGLFVALAGGDARTVLDGASPRYYDVIRNDPGNPGLIPRKGDVIVWGGNAVNPYGHVAVVLKADQQGVDVVQQDGFKAPLKAFYFNDGSVRYYSQYPAHVARLGYWNAGTGMVSGWLRPKASAVVYTGADRRGYGTGTAPTAQPTKQFDLLEWFTMASQKEINAALNAWATSTEGSAALGRAVLDRKFKDSKGRQVSLAYIAKYDKENWDLVRKVSRGVEAITRAVAPKVLGLSVWGYLNEKVNGPDDAYELLGRAASNAKKDTGVKA